MSGARLEFAAGGGQFVHRMPGLGEFLGGRLRLGRGFAELRQFGAERLLDALFLRGEFFQLRFEPVALRLRLLQAFLEPGGLLREPLRTRGVNTVAFRGEALQLRLKSLERLLRAAVAPLELRDLLREAVRGVDVGRHVPERHQHRRLALPGDVGKVDSQDQASPAPSTRNRTWLTGCRWDGFFRRASRRSLRPMHEHPLGARVHEADLAGAVHDHDRLGEILHQRLEVGGRFRRRLRRLIASAFFESITGPRKMASAWRARSSPRPVHLFRTMHFARCQSARKNLSRRRLRRSSAFIFHPSSLFLSAPRSA